MNHRNELRMQSTNSNNLSLASIIGTGILLAVFAIPGALALAETQAEKDALQQKIEQANREYEQATRNLQQVQQQKQTLSNALREINAKQSQVNASIKRTGAEIEKTDDLLQNLGDQILTHEQQIQVGKAVLAQNLRAMYEYQDATLFELLLDTRTLADAWEDIDHRESLREAVGDHLDRLTLTKEQLAEKMIAEAKNKETMAKLIQEKRIENESLAVTQNETSKILKETQNSEAEWQKIVNEKLAKKKQFEQELFAYESKLTYTFKPGELPAEGSAPLAWPLANPYITQFFGATPSSTRLYASGEHSGMDFRAAVGTPIIASASGVVAGVGDTDLTCPRASFGKWIFIKHDNNLAVVYAHMSKISVQVGERVTAGQVIGLSGNTGHSTAPHLHVSVFPADAVSIQNRPSNACPGKVFTMPIAATESYLNPAKYFPAYTPDMVKPGA